MNKGFTLLEILLVIAAIGILAAIVIIAINPNRQLAQVRDAQRTRSTNTIYNAIRQYQIDNDGSLPPDVEAMPLYGVEEICASGVLEADCNAQDLLYLEGELSPLYVASLPSDPGATGLGSGYLLVRDDQRDVSIFTPSTEIQSTPIYSGGNLGVMSIDTFVVENPPIENNNCSLSEAVLAANTRQAVDSCPAGDSLNVLSLQTGTYHITAPYGSGTGLPSIESQVILVGQGVDNTYIQRSSDDLSGLRGTTAPDFRMISVTSNGNLIANNLTIRGGRRNGIYAAGIQNGGILRLNSVRLSDHQSTGWGSAVRSTGTLYMRDSFVVNNSLISKNGPSAGVSIQWSPTNNQIIDTVFDSNQGGWCTDDLIVNNNSRLIMDGVIARNSSCTSMIISSTENVEIRNSSFEDALRLDYYALNYLSQGDLGDLTIINTSFSNTRFDIRAGDVNPGSVFVVRSSFNNSISDSAFRSYLGSGATVSNDFSMLIEESTFLSNQNHFDLGNNGVTLNDPGDVDTGFNGYLNFPVLTSATLINNELIVEGFVGANAEVEFFLSPNDLSFGGASRFLFSRVEGSGDDELAGVSSYGPDVNGITVSTASVSENEFRFTIPVSEIPGSINIGDYLTSTTISGGVTSEFGNNIQIQ